MSDKKRYYRPIEYPVGKILKKKEDYKRAATGVCVTSAPFNITSTPWLICLGHGYWIDTYSNMLYPGELEYLRQVIKPPRKALNLMKNFLLNHEWVLRKPGDY